MQGIYGLIEDFAMKFREYNHYKTLKKKTKQKKKQTVVVVVAVVVYARGFTFVNHTLMQCTAFFTDPCKT